MRRWVARAFAGVLAAATVALLLEWRESYRSTMELTVGVVVGEKAAEPRRATFGRASRRGTARLSSPKSAAAAAGGTNGPPGARVRDLRPLRKRGLALGSAVSSSPARRVPPRRVAPRAAAPPLSTQTRIEGHTHQLR